MDPSRRFDAGGQCGALCRDFDFASTELGDIALWPVGLVAVVDTMLRSPAAMVVMWGPRGVLLYNDAYSQIAGDHHPGAFGKTVADGWPEIAEFNLDVIRKVLSGETLSLREVALVIRRHGVDESARFDLHYSSILGADSKPGGTFAIFVETTKQAVLAAALATKHREYEALEVRLAAEGLDASDRVAAGREAKRREQEFSSLAEAAPLHVWAADAEGSLYWFNARVYQSTGAEPGSLNGANWGRVVHPDDLPHAAQTWANAIRTGVTYETEFRIWSAPHHGYRAYLVRAVPFTDESGAVRWIGTNTDIEDKRIAGEQLALANQNLEDRVAERTAERDRMWRLSQEVMVETGFDGKIHAANPAWKDMLGWSEAEMKAMRLFDLIHRDDWDSTLAETERLANGLPTDLFHNRFRHKNGSYRWISWTAVPDGDFIHAVGRDITSVRDAQETLRATEEALRQAQKMEAVGQLTGGIAHDFNNLLQGITGSIEVVRKLVALGRGDEADRYIASAMSSAQRAAALTHRLLAFSRRQPLDAKPLQINQRITSMEDLLARSLTPSVRLELALDADLWMTLCDGNQVESAILNLVLNARDAMPDGGTIVVKTGNATIDAAGAARSADVMPGEYVCITVTDSGTGMSPDVVERAFDPFFTTKPTGLGTGLGLSMVYGFTRQSGGHASIDSGIGRGSSVSLYLPRYRGSQLPETTVEQSIEVVVRSDARTVLVIDDEDSVRNPVVHTLRELGYRIIEADDGPSGLKILQSDVVVDLLVTDIGLPGLNGRQVADAGRTLRADLKVLFMTGFAESAAAISAGVLDDRMQIIIKPFPMETMAGRVAAMFESAARSDAGVQQRRQRR